MRSTRRRWGAMLGVAAAVSLVGAGGCEKRDDPVVRAAVNQAAVEVAAGQGDKAVQTLSKVTSGEHAVGATVPAKALAGQAYLRQARAKAYAMRTKLLEAARLEQEIVTIGAAVAQGNVLASGYGKLDPGTSRELLGARAAEAQGSPGKETWFTPPVKDGGKATALSTLAVTKQRASALQADVAARQEEIKAFEAQRAAFLKQANELTDAIAGKTGQESVDAFAKASGMRKQASLVSAKIESAATGLAAAQRDLLVAEGQQKVLESFIAGSGDASKRLGEGYELVKGSAGAQKTLSGKVVTAGADDAWTLSTKAKQYGETLKAAADLRGEAEKLFGEAEAQFASAREEAGKLQGRLRSDETKSRFVKKQNDDLRATLDTAPLAMYAGIAQYEMGMVQLSAAGAEASRARVGGRLTTVLKEAGLELPAELAAGTAEESAKASYAAAGASLKAAGDALDGAVQAGSGKLVEIRRKQARLALMMTRYGETLVARAQGDTGRADSQLAEAIKIRDELKGEGSEASLPMLPAELTPATVAPAAPAAPTPEPATAPADGG